MKFLSILLSVSLVFLWLGVSWGAEKTVTIRFTHEQPESHQLNLAAVKLAGEINKRSNGSMILKVFPSAQLFSDKNSVKAISEGVVSMGMVPIAYWVGYTPCADVFELPFIFPDYKTAYEAEDGILGDAIKEDAEKVGIKILGWWDYGPTHFSSRTKPLRRPEDFKGLRIRVYGSLPAMTVKVLGGAPAFMSGGEVYLALQRGTVDGAVTGFTGYFERKLYEVVKYLLVAPQGYQTYPVMINKNFWEGLSKDQQKVILDAIKPVTDEVRTNVEKINENDFKAIVNKGMVPYVANKDELKEFFKITQPVRDEFVRKHGDRVKKIVEAISKE